MNMTKEEVKKIADGILYADLTNRGHGMSVKEKEAYNMGVMHLADKVGRRL